VTPECRPSLISCARRRAAGADARRKVTGRFPGIRVVAEDIFVDGDKVAVRSSVIGTADGGPHPMLFEIFRVEDGRLAEMWGVTQGPHPS
jgi:predicted SnoaL-like aldol condensation-catalyzing enzyme